MLFRSSNSIEEDLKVALERLVRSMIGTASAVHPQVESLVRRQTSSDDLNKRQQEALAWRQQCEHAVQAEESAKVAMEEELNDL